MASIETSRLNYNRIIVIFSLFFLIHTCKKDGTLTLMHSERPKLHGVLAVLSAIGLKK